MKPLLLDLFCGAGGASKGYADAGFDVIGVDIKPQPHYPYDFIQADWESGLMTVLHESYWSVAFIHASPPCQTFTRGQKLRKGKKASTPDLLVPVRETLKRLQIPYVIENVPGAPLINPLTLCGSTFGLKVRRHRLFESSEYLYAAGPCKHKEQGKPVGVYHAMNDQVKGKDYANGEKIVYGGRTAATLQEGQEAMGIDWMTWPELREAIPPAYTTFIGRQLIFRHTIFQKHQEGIITTAQLDWMDSHGRN
jgi:DNA (cytosine-5)-methyltransferase 1